MRSIQFRNKFIYKYIIDSINWTDQGFNLKTEPVTDTERLQWLYDTFLLEKWKVENIKRYHHHNIYKGFTDWLQGLPSSFHIAWNYHDIIELAKKTGALPDSPTEKEEDKIIDNYWNYITNKTFQLFKKHHINIKEA